ncbi:caspase, EACC1-associated type [Streptomyces chilikensis]|uniref:caspase, EACC1-associated type n=1 Tax=Streptomyces chilikensis TaxID=1194079 RepID=UPI00140D2386|nr:caspase family protein [Streptomyces chilikensis]
MALPGVTGDLAAPACHAVVVGTGRHPGDLLPGLPSAVASAEALAETLSTVCGMEDRVTLLTDPTSPSEVLEALTEAVDRAAPAEGRPGRGAVLFCFIGHGLRGPGGRPYLATAATRSLTDTAHAVPYAEVERYLSDGAADPVVILDCCFAGNAREPGRPPSADLFGGSRPDGSYLLAATQRNTLAYAPPDAEFTLFTGHLLRLLREGDPGGAKWLTLAGAYRLLDQRLQGAAARPYGGGTARMGDLVLTANRRYPSRPEPEPGPPAEDPDAVCPYPGLVPFLPEQHRWFFGREEVTRALLGRLADTRPARPLLVIGTSGVGKSSLLRAGLGVEAESAGLGPVRIVPSPGQRPFRTLAEDWAAAVGLPVSETVREMERGRFPAGASEDGGADEAGGATVGSGLPAGRRAPSVLVVDQLEEYFTHCDDPDERRRFATVLSAAEGPRIVLALRADYYDDLLKDPYLAPLAGAGHFTVPALGKAEIQAAVVAPAHQVGLRWEPGVPELLCREVTEERGGGGAGDAAALPFLAHVLREIWLRRRGTELTHAAYQETGGIRDAVARTAERIHDGLDESGRARLRQLMLAMVRVADGEGRLVRRTVSREETAGSEDLLRRLADARLAVVDEDGSARLGHDSLLHAWRRLTGWIEEARDQLLRLRRLTEAAESWAENGSGLWEDDSLEQARRLVGHAAGRRPGRAESAGPTSSAAAAVPQVPVRPVVRDFVDASDRAQRRRRLVTRAWVAGLSALALVASVLAGWAFRENGRAAERELDLIARELATKADQLRPSDPQTALHLSLAAYRTARTPETRSSLYAAATTLAPVRLAPAGEHREPVLNLAYSPDGRTLAAGHRRGRIQLWDVTKPSVPVEADAWKAEGNAALAYHPTRPLLAAVSPTALTLWDTEDPQRPRQVSRTVLDGARTYSVAFSGDGRTLAAGSQDGRLRLWDVRDPASPRQRADREVASADLISLAFTRDGHGLVTGNGNGEDRDGRKQPAQVRLWDVRDAARPVLRDTEPADTVMSVAAHPRQDLVVAAGAWSKVAWWEVVDGRQLRRVRMEDWESFTRDDTPSLAFSRDGRFLAAANRSAGVNRIDATADVSRLADSTSANLARLPALEETRAVAYRPDGTYLAAGDVGGEIQLWPETPWAPSVPGSPSSGAQAGTGAFTADGTLVLTQDIRRGATRVWDVRNPAAPMARHTMPEKWEAKYFLTRLDSPVLLAHHWAGGEEHTFQLWSFGDHGAVRRSTPVPVTADTPVAVVSPDNRLLAAGSREEGGVTLWDLRDPMKPVRRGSIELPLKTQPFNTGQAWFAGDRTLATIEDGRHLRFWDVSDPARPREGGLIEEAASGAGAGFVSSSRLLLTESVGAGVRLWDVSRPGHPAEASELPAAPGGYMPTVEGELATSLGDGTLQFWDVTDPFAPRRKRAIRLDHQVSSIRLTADARLAVTGNPPSLWSVGKDGRWDTPAFVRLDGVESVVVPPAGSPGGKPRWMGAVIDDDDGEAMYFLDFDADRLHEAMCESFPMSVPEERWQVLFPHLEHRSSCG